MFLFQNPHLKRDSHFLQTLLLFLLSHSLSVIMRIMCPLSVSHEIKVVMSNVWARTSWHPLFLQTETTYQDHTVCLWTAVSGRYTQSVIVVRPVNTLRVHTMCLFYIFVKEKDFGSLQNLLLTTITKNLCWSKDPLTVVYQSFDFYVFFKDWIYRIEQPDGSLGTPVIN